MDPEADDLYDRLGADPATPHADLKKKISAFAARYHGGEYTKESSEIQRHLNDEESRREYNRKKCYPVDWDVDEVIDLTVKGPDIVEVSEPVTISVVDGDGDPVENAAVTVSGTDLGTTDGRGRCSFAFDETGTTSIKVDKDGSEKIRYHSDVSDIEVTKERRELHISADATEVSVDEPVRFSVTDADGDPIKNAVVKLPTGQRTTDASGECTYTFRSADSFEIEAAKDDDGDITYASASITVRVEPKIVPLSASVDLTEITVGEPVSITVVNRREDTPIENARLSYAGRTEKTDSNGRATIEFDTAGSRTIEVTRPDDRDTTYKSDSVTIEVDRLERSLSINPRDSAATAGDPITISVTDSTGTPIDDAAVSGGGKSATTDSRGTCTLTFAETGTTTLTASKDKTPAATFDGDRVDLTVEKRSERLNVEAESTTVDAHEPVEIRVQDSSGDWVPDAIVETPSGERRTDDRGKCTVKFSTVGSAEVTARKPDTDVVSYASDEISIKVQTRKVNLNVSTNVDTIEAGDPVFVTVRDTNGNRVKDAIVSAGSTNARTNDRGRCTISPASEGIVRVSAEKEDKPTVEFNEDTTTLEVLLEERDLHIEAPDEAPAGDSVSVIVRDEEGERIEGAVVSSPAAEAPTDSRGTCEIALPNANVANVTARRSASDGIRYTRDTVRIDLTGAMTDPGSDEASANMNPVILTVAVGFIAVIPAVGALFVFDFGIDLPVIFGTAVAIVFVLTFILLASR